MLAEYDDLDGIALAELVKARDVSALELVEAAIGRIETRNPVLNAVVLNMFVQARSAALDVDSSTPFAGVPFLMKDLLSTVQGVPTSHGNRLWAKLAAGGDSEIVKRWKKAGLIILGKTNTPEFGLTPYTESETFGPARNPWDLERTPGGSSGGSGAAVAACMVPLASSGDGGGSIRIPASACGVFGMKPTRGRTPAGPHIGEPWAGFAVEHVLTRSVRDSAALLDLVQGADVGAPHYLPPFSGSFLNAVAAPLGKLRIAASSTPMLGGTVEPEVLAAFADAAKLLEELGHEVVEAAPQIDAEPFSLSFLTVLAAELRVDVEEAAKAAGVSIRIEDFDAAWANLLRRRTCSGSALPQAGSSRCHVLLRDLRRAYDASAFEGTPADRGAPAILPGEDDHPRDRPHQGGVVAEKAWHSGATCHRHSFMPWTPVFNVTGQPATSVPLFWTDSGLPIGTHFVGRFGDEATLFQLAGQLERARPWSHRKPPLCLPVRRR